jgi:Protein of unknown function (DUF3225)
MMDEITINIPSVVAEMTVVFALYESALVNNDVTVLDELFWNSSHTIRYGVTENLHGYEAIAQFRSNRPSTNLARSLQNTVITTYGYHSATANTEFERNGKTGRQSQTWIKFPEGWRVVSAHVSLL